jgi:hypothetical protein
MVCSNRRDHVGGPVEGEIDTGVLDLESFGRCEGELRGIEFCAVPGHLEM